MTLKQKTFAKKLVETGNGTQAALEVYNTSDANTAAVIASKNIRNDKVKEEVNRLLERKGLSLEQVSESIGIIFQRGVETKVTGDNVLKAAELVFRLHNAFPTQKSTHVRVDYRQELEKMSYQELQGKRLQTQLEVDEILQG